MAMQYPNIAHLKWMFWKTSSFQEHKELSKPVTSQVERVNPAAAKPFMSPRIQPCAIDMMPELIENEVIPHPQTFCSSLLIWWCDLYSANIHDGWFNGSMAPSEHFHTIEEWDRIRPVFTRLYQEERKKLDEVRKILEYNWNFTTTWAPGSFYRGQNWFIGSVKQCKTKIREWNLGKYKKVGWSLKHADAKKWLT